MALRAKASICTLRAAIRVGLDMVDDRGELVVRDQVGDPGGMEVRDADGAHRALRVSGLERPPRPLVVAVRLVDQDQVELVEAELFSQ